MEAVRSTPVLNDHTRDSIVSHRHLLGSRSSTNIIQQHRRAVLRHDTTHLHRYSLPSGICCEKTSLYSSSVRFKRNAGESLEVSKTSRTFSNNVTPRCFGSGSNSHVRLISKTICITQVHCRLIPLDDIVKFILSCLTFTRISFAFFALSVHFALTSGNHHVSRLGRYKLQCIPPAP